MKVIIIGASDAMQMAHYKLTIIIIINNIIIYLFNYILKWKATVFFYSFGKANTKVIGLCYVLSSDGEMLWWWFEWTMNVVMELMLLRPVAMMIDVIVINTMMIDVIVINTMMIDVTVINTMMPITDDFFRKPAFNPTVDWSYLISPFAVLSFPSFVLLERSASSTAPFVCGLSLWSMTSSVSTNIILV